MRPREPPDVRSRAGEAGDRGPRRAGRDDLPPRAFGLSRLLFLDEHTDDLDLFRLLRRDSARLPSARFRVEDVAAPAHVADKLRGIHAERPAHLLDALAQ